ncbi:MAG: c-type cytochrome [Caldilinea sp.]|nr:c-type cytochrome [Caldilinea sp.]MCB0146717.1 c-type cytochrome [Caldilineaceae bacterium]MCB9115408.1 c-type cytochrome [Caldilineaceae bacterium]MCB9119232.1 c-type cytochrome [Caldilineaceae bacterium]MCB9123548.1 c-type cytochrome [Caldilineaceae bacterium]
MNRTDSFVHMLGTGVATLALATLLAGCGATPTPDVADVTPIPVYTPWSAAAAPAEATATATPLPATQEPTALPPTATTAPTATQEPSATPEATATSEATATPVPTATAKPTATELPAATETQAAPEAPATEPAAAVETPAAEAPAETAPADAMQLPADFAAALEGADAANGEQLTVSNGCIACHSLVEGQTLVGPSWYGVGSHAENRVPGESAPFYLYQSIMEPNAHVVEGFTPDLMPKVYADTLSTAQIADIVAYLLSLQAE